MTWKRLSSPAVHTYDRRGAVCHSMAFMFMWHYQNAHMTAHQLCILTRRHRKTFGTSTLTDMTFHCDPTFLRYMSPPVLPSLFLSLFFSPSIHSLHPKVNHRRVDALSRKLVNVFSPRRCYLLPADRAMNSGPTWNSYCYQKHKIPITLGVRAETRKWNRYS